MNVSHRTKFLLASLAVLLSAATAGCQHATEAAPVAKGGAEHSATEHTAAEHYAGRPGLIKLYCSLPRTGDARPQTDSIVNGVRMAIDEVGGKIGDYEIELEDHDDATASAGKWTAEQENKNAHEAASDPDVMAYIGPYNSNAAKGSMPILNQAGLLMISPSNTSVGLTKPNPANPYEPEIYRPTGKVNYVRVIPTDDLQGALGADWAKAMGHRRVFVLDDNEMYGAGLSKIFMDRCREIGLEVLGSDSIDAKSLEFRPLMTAIKAKQPDLIYFGGTTQSKAGQIAKDLVAVGLTAKLMVPDGCMEEAFISSAGAENLNDRCYVTFGGLTNSALEEAAGKAATDKQAAELLAENKPLWKFLQAYKSKFGRDAEAYAVYGYEAGKVTLEAIRRAGEKDRAAIVAACLGIKDFHGAVGQWSFDSSGDTTSRRMGGYIVHDGKFKLAQMLSESGAKP